MYTYINVNDVRDEQLNQQNCDGMSHLFCDLKYYTQQTSNTVHCFCPKVFVNHIVTLSYILTEIVFYSHLAPHSK